MNCTTKQRRRAAWILLVGFLLAILVSLTFCAEEVDHDCSGADCVLCAQLKLCENILHAGKDGEHFYEKTQTYIRCIFLPFTGFLHFGWLWKGRIFVHSCTVCIAEWQQAAENRHDYFPGV